MARHILFWLVVFATNIIQGITGFAGTILAMPPGILLVGYNTAKPILNVLGVLAGLFVFCTNARHVDWKEFGKVVGVMTVGLLGGFWVKTLLQGDMSVLYLCLGFFVIALAIHGFRSLYRPETERDVAPGRLQGSANTFLLLSAGVVHGIFVSGGPLLIAYLSRTLRDKTVFRATISTVWIVLNTIIFFDDFHHGLWTPSLWKEQLVTLPFFLVGMGVGTRLYSKMDQVVFLKLTYLLLFASGVLLLFK